MKAGLRSKLTVLYVFLAIIPAVTVGILSYRISYNALWNNTVHSTMQIADQLNNSIETLFADTERFMEIGKSEYVVNYISGKGDSYNDAKEILSLFRVYRSNFPFKDSIKSIYIIGANGKSISERGGVLLLDDFSEKANDLMKELGNTGQTQIITGNISEGTDDTTSHIYVGQTQSLPSLRDPFCTVIVELDSTAIEEFCNSVDIAGTGYFTIFDVSGEVIFGSKYQSKMDQQRIFENIKADTSGNFIDTLNGEDAFFLFNTSTQTNWKIVGQVAIADLMKESTSIARTTFTALLLILALAVILYIYFSNKLINPLKKLNVTMRIAALGDMDVRYNAKTSDEINDLGESFNQMIQRLDALAKQNMREQASLRRSELKLLQAQINPHFLYNTLDTILWQAQAGYNEDVVEMVDALSRFFRTTLSKGRDWIDVETEINLVKDYLCIQKKRYGEILNYEIQVDKAIYNYPILKLTLQPLVENALYHGLKNKRGGGTITVRGWEQEGNLLFDIEDDGIGMSLEKIRELSNELNSHPNIIEAAGDGGFGLKNVNSRIKLYYGDGFGICIKQREKGGTIIHMCLRR